MQSIMPAQSDISTEQASAIARDAYTYGFPLVEGYKTLYKQAVDVGNSDYRAPFNQIAHARDVATPADAWVVTPNSDTPYSFAWLDLRAEPIVITMPQITQDRYYSAQLIDLQTFNFDYLGTRVVNNDGGNFLIAGPGWQGKKPDGVNAVIHCETELFYALFRTQLFNPDDIGNVNNIQDGYLVRPLSTYLGMPAPTAAPAIDWPEPAAGMTETETLFNYLNFLLQFVPTHPTEIDLMARFAKLGIGANETFDFKAFTPDVQAAILEGIEAVWSKDFAGIMTQLNAGELDSGDFFGTREYLDNNYLYRFAGAKLGIYGNTKEEALYPSYFVDDDGNEPDASRNGYEIRFEQGQLPPTNAFWSLTMYDGKSQLLVDNEIDRYLLNSTMVDSFKYADDRSLTLYLQRASPGADLQSNWLPAPNGQFYVILRIYIPKQEVLDGQWTQPKLTRANKTSVETRIGNLEFDLGLPTEGTVSKLFDEIDFQRACQAYLWAMPIVNIGEWQRAHNEDFDAGDGDIVIYTSYKDKLGILTPNITTPYIIGFANLENTGPLVIVYPKGLSAGGVLDFWQRPLFDMGQTGPDGGNGAKYLVVGPGQEVANTDDYHVYQSSTFNIGIGYRVLETDPDKAEALMRAVQIYPFSERDNPQHINRFLTPGDIPWSQTPPSGMVYWERLAVLLNREAVAERDQFFMAMLKPLGIEKDKPFQPDARQRQILTEAAFVGEQMAKANSFDKRFPRSRYRDDARWEILFAPGFSPNQIGVNYGQLDERAAYTWEAVWTTAGMVIDEPGKGGQAYLAVHRDQSGDPMDGAKAYCMHIPADPPADQFWSVTIYDLETRRPVENANQVVDCSSLRESLVPNDDGSVDIYFGPTSKEGLEANSLITVPGRAWFPLFRLYGPKSAYFEGSWPLPDIRLDEKTGATAGTV
jgi:hypothetical protein